MASTPALMSLFGDAGIVSSTSLAGYGTFLIAYPLAKSGKLAVHSALIDKGLRYIPVILCVMSLDMIWYLPLTGPFASRVGAVVAEKCSKYWWRSILFIGNVVGDSIDICSGHTYSLSVDMHLMMLGLIAVLLFAKKPAFGIAYSLLMICIGIGLGLYYGTVHELVPNLIVARNPSVMDLERLLKYIHMATSSYVPSYFSAMMLAYFVYEGHFNQFAVKVNHVAWCSAILVTSHIVQYAPILTNTLNAVSKPYIPLYIVGVRAVVAIELMCMLAYAAVLDIHVKLVRRASEETGATVTPAPGEGTRKPQFSFWKMLLRLSFSLYMCNYLFIRMDFFTARTVFYNDVFHYSKRLLATLIILIPGSIVYQLFFIAPFMSLVNDIQRSQVKRD